MSAACRRLVSILALLGSACTAPPDPAVERPDVSVVRQWPEGQRFAAVVARGLPDAAPWAALPFWWRAALRQTERFRLIEASDEALPTLELAVDPSRGNVRATLLEPAPTLATPRRVELAAASFAANTPSRGLLPALDRLAWACRLAVGESAPPPRPLTAITSPDSAVVLAIDDAEGLIATGGFASALRALQLARRRDGGAPALLMPLASLALLRGDAVTAERIAVEALGYEARLSPTVQHRLARTLLMARAARNPAEAETYDRELLRLGRTAAEERPHDDQPRWTCAIAHDFLGSFDRARVLLERLEPPPAERGFVDYHLGWACLGTDDAAAAADHLARSALRLPAPWVLLPRAIALFEAGRPDDLEALLQEALDEQLLRDRDDLLVHQILRMQAAHAVLRQQPERARERLWQDLQWYLGHGLSLAQRAGEFGEAGAVFVRLGSDRDLPSLLASIQQQHTGSVVADAAAFVGGMHDVQRTGQRAHASEAMLARQGDHPWAMLLAAYAHERNGEVGDMQNALARAAALTSSPLTTSLLARSLRLVGEQRHAERLQQTLQREMLQVHLRRRCQHPIYGPELAYAFMLR